MALSKVEFFSGMAHKLPYVGRLLRKAVDKGARVAVMGDAKTLQALDADLWTAHQGDFIPHVSVLGHDAPAPRMHRTPVWLVTDIAQAQQCSVLVNLGPDTAPLDAPVDRLIEIVSQDPADRETGRRRWRAYEAAGLAIEHHALDRRPDTVATHGDGA